MNPTIVDESHFIRGICIGRGGFGKVYACIHKGTGVQMAMKCLIKHNVAKRTWQAKSVWIERNLLEMFTCPYLNSLYFAFQVNIVPKKQNKHTTFYLFCVIVIQLIQIIQNKFTKKNEKLKK